jgi:hypothetical protein
MVLVATAFLGYFLHFRLIPSLSILYPAHLPYMAVQSLAAALRCLQCCFCLLAGIMLAGVGMLGGAAGAVLPS